ncbi:MAG: AI-2E family transporter [Ruminococcaceae bacterium]|nr:AI-2E family transporter [Oscillospiraceae bacterium]
MLPSPKTRQSPRKRMLPRLTVKKQSKTGTIMEFPFEKIKSISKWIIAIAAICIVIFLGLQNIGIIADAFGYVIDLVMPILLGGIIALILDVPMRFFESLFFANTEKPILQKLRRPLAFLVSLLIIIGVIVGVIFLVIPELIAAIKIVIDEIVDLVENLRSMSSEELSRVPLGEYILSLDWDGITSDVQNWIYRQSGDILNTAVGTLSTLLGGIFDIFISFVFGLYILFGKETLKKQASRILLAWFPKKVGEWTIHVATIANTNFRNFVSGQSLEAVILGSLCMVGMLILQIPFAPMVGTLVGVTALIPVIGAFIGAGVGAFMILTVSPIKAVIFVVFLLILQQLEGNLIYPKVMGSKMNLPSICILAAVTIGGGIAGTVGMLLSVPIASTLYTLIKESTLKREKEMERSKKELSKKK